MMSARFMNDDRLVINPITVPKKTKEDFLKLLREYNLLTETFTDTEIKIMIEDNTDIRDIIDKDELENYLFEMSEIENDWDEFTFDHEGMFGVPDNPTEDIGKTIMGLQTLENEFTFLGMQIGSSMTYALLYIDKNNELNLHYPSYGNQIHVERKCILSENELDSDIIDDYCDKYEITDTSPDWLKYDCNWEAIKTDIKENFKVSK